MGHPAPADIALITFNVVPDRNETLKYSRLGPLGVSNHRAYCARHGYRFIDNVSIAADRPACWAKIPAILAAFGNHRWVACADSDTFILDPLRPLETFIDGSCDMIVQSPREWFRFINLDADLGFQVQPVNTGVFMMRASQWSRMLLMRAYACEQFVTRREIWNGVGEQEAINSVLEASPNERVPIKYVEDLQASPQLYRRGTLFVHFYGNHASHRYPKDACAAVIGNWGRAISGYGPARDELALVHWCAIQNNNRTPAVDRGGPSKFGYDPETLDLWMMEREYDAVRKRPVSG